MVRHRVHKSKEGVDMLHDHEGSREHFSRAAVSVGQQSALQADIASKETDMARPVPEVSFC